MNSISCIWLEFRKEKEKQTHNQTQPDPNSTQAQPKLPWKPNSNPALGPTCLAQLNPTRAQLPSSLALAQQLKPRTSFPSLQREDRFSLGLPTLVRPISPAASAARPAHPRHPHAALSPSLTGRPHLSAPPSPSRRAATRSRDHRRRGRGSPSPTIPRDPRRSPFNWPQRTPLHPHPHAKGCHKP